MAGKSITALNGRICPLALGSATLKLDQRGDPELTKDFIVGAETGRAIAIATADPSSFVTYSTAGFLNGAAAFGPNGMFTIDNLGGLRIFVSSVLTGLGVTVYAFLDFLLHGPTNSLHTHRPQGSGLLYMLEKTTSVDLMDTTKKLQYFQAGDMIVFPKVFIPCHIISYDFGKEQVP
ncbi:unnamed protein product [Calypogeia fissa]